MTRQLLAKHCSATFAGLKTGSMFSFEVTDRERLFEDMRRLNKLLTRKGLRAIPIRLSEQRALIYVYRIAHLMCDLKDPCAEAILKSKGYSCTGDNTYITELMKRLEQSDEFPHEIGLFLGYPPEDVQGFIDSPCDGFKCVGSWKVYGDMEAAKKKFRRYRKCREVYGRQLSEGKPLDRMIVETRGA